LKLCILIDKDKSFVHVPDIKSEKV